MDTERKSSLTYSATHSLAHLPSRPLTHPLANLFAHLLTHSLIHSTTCLFTHSPPNHSFAHQPNSSLSRSFAYPPAHSFTHQPTHLFTQLSAHSLAHPLDRSLIYSSNLTHLTHLLDLSLTCPTTRSLTYSLFSVLEKLKCNLKNYRGKYLME